MSGCRRTSFGGPARSPSRPLKVVALVVLTLSGCTLSHARGPMRSTAVQPVRCSDAVVRGDVAVTPDAEYARITLRGERTCAASTVTVYERQHWQRFDTVGSILVVCASGLVAGGASVAAYSVATAADPPPSSSSSFNVGAAVVTVSFLAGMGLGVFPALLGRRELPSTTETIERPGTPVVEPVTVEGELVSSAGERWAVTGGRLELALDAFDPDGLVQARFGGAAVEWSNDALDRLASYGFCRRALAHERCPALADAERCEKGGWPAGKMLRERAEACMAGR